MSREELASTLWRFHLAGPERQCSEILAAGWRKLSLDDATVERAARAIFPGYWDNDAAECFETPEALAECQKGCTDHVRTVLAAAVEEGQ